MKTRRRAVILIAAFYSIGLQFPVNGSEVPMTLLDDIVVSSTSAKSGSTYEGLAGKHPIKVSLASADDKAKVKIFTSDGELFFMATLVAEDNGKGEYFGIIKSLSFGEGTYKVVVQTKYDNLSKVTSSESSKSSARPTIRVKVLNLSKG